MSKGCVSNFLKHPRKCPTLTIPTSSCTDPRPRGHPDPIIQTELELTETMATVCGAHKAAFRVYLTILDHPHSTIAEIAEILDRGQSTIGKQLQPLYEHELDRWTDSVMTQLTQLHMI
ncbi:hypothetical protein SAMN05421858_4859 [Haladaptatus litoreus]|uniref:Uncharacterized protein n=1 Tax=Haladaptatus litoreus TaxID=553468 RepID=A0A1N7F9U9_9EURY|nr:hypothetical protein SAMN05421858_4859 [Haladaptatus litoreus]